MLLPTSSIPAGKKIRPTSNNLQNSAVFTYALNQTKDPSMYDDKRSIPAVIFLVPIHGTVPLLNFRKKIAQRPERISSLERRDCLGSSDQEIAPRRRAFRASVGPAR
jgi:hypothetical protein